MLVPEKHTPPRVGPLITNMSQSQEVIFIDHIASSPEEEHDGAGVVQLIHLVEVRHFGDVHQVDDCKVLHLSRQRHRFNVECIE